MDDTVKWYNRGDMLQLSPKGPDLWDSILPEEARTLPEDLSHVDELLRDRRFMEPFVRRFDERTGRPGVPVATYLRLMYLRRKHRLSYEALTETVSGSIPWRTFCGIGCQDRVPDASTLARLTRVYGEDTLHELHTLVTDDLAEWTIRRRRRQASEGGSRRNPSRGGLAQGGQVLGGAGRSPFAGGGLVLRLTRIPGVGRALAAIIDRAKAAMSAEARPLRPSRTPSAPGERRVDLRLLSIVRETAARVRRLVDRVKDPRLQRQAQLALDLPVPADRDRR